MIFLICLVICTFVVTRYTGYEEHNKPFCRCYCFAVERIGYYPQSIKIRQRIDLTAFSRIISLMYYSPCRVHTRNITLPQMFSVSHRKPGPHGRFCWSRMQASLSLPERLILISLQEIKNGYHCYKNQVILVFL